MSNAKLDEAHARLAESVATLSTSTGWAEYLTTAARFHNYSARNVWLIMCQRPDATQVAGYRTWPTVGRHVVKGAKGIAILAPCRFKETADDGTETYRLGGFRVEHVFDVSDTDGDPLPENPARPTLLTGEAPAGMWDYLAGEVERRGFRIEVGAIDGTANGYTQFATKVVRIADGRSDASRAKTLAHELAHVILHEEATDRPTMEVEAESVAFLVCDSFGLASDDYSFGYVATWADADARKVLDTAKRVIGCADEVLAGRVPVEVAA